MEITIEQTLQQAIEAHKEGKAQDAKRLYLAILHSQPLHPHANHNLGVLAVSVNKAEAALPLFKTALEANPTIKQFWLSYIDALIKEKQFDNAKAVIEQAKKQGVAGDELNPLEVQLSFETQNVNSANPPQQQLNNLLEYYQMGRYDDAERLAVSITERFPNHPFAWKVLGVVLKKTGRIIDSLTSMKKSVQLAPQDASAHSNLGVTLQDMGRLNEAEASFKWAIVLKPDYAEAHYNLGIMLQALGRLDGAEASYTRVIALKADYAEAHNNLGVTLNELGRLDEAEASYTQAITLKADYAEAHNNLGNTLKELGRLDEAEAILRQAIALKPDFAEAHYNLGNTLKELGRLDEAEASYTKAIMLKPDYAQAHNNLGITLKELGKLGESEAILRQAIAFKSDYAQAHNNLGNTLQELGRLDEAEARLRQAIALKPDYAEAHSNLGITLQELGRLDKAEVSYGHAIALKPDYAEAHSNLGNTLKELGKLDEAEASLRQAIVLKHDFAEAFHNLSIVQSYMNNLEAEIVSLQNILQIDADNYGLRGGVNLAICNFLEGDFEDSKKYLLAAAKIQEKTSLEFKHEKVYGKYLLDILSWHEEKYFNTCNRKTSKLLYVIGESHSLVSHQLHAQSSDSVMLCKAKLIKGCKQWHLGNSNKNQYKRQFESIFCSLPKTSEVLLAIGEIDCRLDSGIIKHNNKFPKKEIEGIIITTVTNYLAYIEKNNSGYQHNIIIQGVPCPNIDMENCSEKEVTQLIEVIKKFNCELKNKAKKKGFEFLDVHKLTNRGDGFSNAVWHIDNIHLSPDGMLEAWRKYASKKKYV